MSFWTLSKARVSLHLTLTVLGRPKWIKAKLHHVVLCLIKHIQLSQFRHILMNYSLKWIPRSFLELNLNNKP